MNNVNIPKWGFGMAPIKQKTKEKYTQAVTAVFQYINGKTHIDDINLDHLSEVKGLLNRCIRQDQ